MLSEDEVGAIAKAVCSDLATSGLPIEIHLSCGKQPVPALRVARGSGPAEHARMFAARVDGRWYFNVIFRDEPSACYVEVRASDSRARSLLRLVEAAQELVLESPASDHVWPMCPSHPNHPLWAQNDPEGTFWVCPESSQIRILVGTLSA